MNESKKDNQQLSALNDEAIRWLEYGQQGFSVCNIFWKTTGYKPDLLLAINHPEARYPIDPDDLSRCRLLLEQVQTVRERFSVMRDVSPVWDALVEHWDDLCATMDKEAPYWREGKIKAPETYKISCLMKEIFVGVQA